jgi:hypothetical protein
MATPHVVGLAAYLLSLGGKISPAALKTKIQGLATPNAVNMGTAVRAVGTPNYLAYNGWTA